MKSYIIRLLDFPNSVDWANKTYESGKKHNWDIHFFDGVNGQKETLNDYNIKVNSRHKKSIEAFNRLGTVGCLLSHYKLWNHCLALDKSICILEHDVIIHKPLKIKTFTDILKIIKGPETKQIYLGKWWASGAGYCISPSGAAKLIKFVNTTGAMPADVMLNTGIVDIQFDLSGIAEINQHSFSFTWEL